MLQVRVHGPDDVRLDEVPEPTPGPRDAVVRVASCGICGSDLGYIRLGGLAGPTPDPMPLGHELSGIVETVGAEVAGLAAGDRVVLNPADPRGGLGIGNGGGEGGFAPLLLVRDAAEGTRLFRVPEAVPLERAALAEPLGVGMNAVEKGGVVKGEKVVVFGAGPIGLAAIATLRQRGVEDVVSVDLSPRRLEIARQLGARETIDAGQDEVWKRLRAEHGEVDFMGGRVPASDVFIEASGASTVIGEVIGKARKGARLTVVALHRAPIEVSFLLVLMKELQINGAIEYPDDYTKTLDLLSNADLSPMITHRFPLERFGEALEVARDGAVAGKVMVDLEPA